MTPRPASSREIPRRAASAALRRWRRVSRAVPRRSPDLDDRAASSRRDCRRAGRAKSILCRVRADKAHASAASWCSPRTRTAGSGQGPVPGPGQLGQVRPSGACSPRTRTARSGQGPVAPPNRHRRAGQRCSCSAGRNGWSISGAPIKKARGVKWRVERNAFVPDISNLRLKLVHTYLRRYDSSAAGKYLN